jgi:uncharacterized membrane protein YphA (DoxX/SURF4 family)
MLASSIMMFSRITIALLFLFSGGGKLVAWRDFAVTIGDFQLFPRRWSKMLALFFMSGEIATATCLVSGGPLLALGFTMAIVLLIIFSRPGPVAQYHHELQLLWQDGEANFILRCCSQYSSDPVQPRCSAMARSPRAEAIRI